MNNKSLLATKFAKFYPMYCGWPCTPRFDVVFVFGLFYVCLRFFGRVAHRFRMVGYLQF